MHIPVESVNADHSAAGNSPSSLVPTSGSASAIAGEDKRKRLIALLRGFFATPVIATLGEVGIADKLLAGRCRVSDFGPGIQPDTATSLLRYLHSIGLLQETAPGEYLATSTGRTAIQRNGAFSLLMSYAEYFDALPALLRGEGVHATVNRLRNVRGSGQLHSRKFFPSALGLFDAAPPTAMIDIGCGDGCFLAQGCEKWPNMLPFGVDLSDSAVKAATERLNALGRSAFQAIVANGFEVSTWSQQVPDGVRSSGRLIISMWFVGHEFSLGAPERIDKFFSQLHHYFPSAQVVLGEINRISPGDLSENRDVSIMPEFLLFHELSGQGVLSWDAWRDVLERIPYNLLKELRFDEVHPRSGEPVPSSFLWLLQPKESANLIE